MLNFGCSLLYGLIHTWLIHPPGLVQLGSLPGSALQAIHGRSFVHPKDVADKWTHPQLWHLSPGRVRICYIYAHSKHNQWWFSIIESLRERYPRFASLLMMALLPTHTPYKFHILSVKVCVLSWWFSWAILKITRFSRVMTFCSPPLTCVVSNCKYLYASGVCDWLWYVSP